MITFPPPRKTTTKASKILSFRDELASLGLSNAARIIPTETHAIKNSCKPVRLSPKTKKDNPYVPANMPALDDLFDAFDFDHPVDQPFTE